MSDLTILGFAGSLRTRSINRALLRAAAELAPDGVELRIHDLHDVPLYNGDLDTPEATPAGVAALKDAIAAADALLVVTPEYNYGLPGVLKNALDWASRPGFRSPMVGKPCGIMGATPGGTGTVRAQEQLKLALMAVLARPMPHPGVAVSRAGGRFDDDLRLTDEATREFIGAYLGQLAEFARQQGAG